MKRHPQNIILQFLLMALVSSVLSGCALNTYISHLKNTPTFFLSHTPLTTKTTKAPLTFTETPTSEATNTSTVTPGQTATATPVPCSDIYGTVIQRQVPSIELGVVLPVSIYLPPCYDSNINYPVLYLLHGQGMTDRYWLDDLGVAEIADAAIQNGQTPFIMVFPYEERNLDDNSTSKFPDAMINDLIPWVDANYATCTQRVCRAIGGISRGGGWAIKLVMRNFDLFGTMGAHSYGLMYGDAQWVQKNLETHTIADFPRIYLDRGDKDSLAHDIDYYVQVLQSNAITPIFHIYPGSHTKSYWRSHVQEYMDFYMAAWPEPIPES